MGAGLGLPGPGMRIHDSDQDSRTGGVEHFAGILAPKTPTKVSTDPISQMGKTETPEAQADPLASCKHRGQGLTKSLQMWVAAGSLDILPQYIRVASQLQEGGPWAPLESTVSPCSLLAPGVLCPHQQTDPRP